MNIDLLLRNSIIHEANSIQINDKKEVIRALEHTSLMLTTQEIPVFTVNNWLLQLADFYNKNADTSTRYFIYKFVEKHQVQLCASAQNNREVLKRFSFILTSILDQSKIFTLMILKCLHRLFSEHEVYIYHYILDIFLRGFKQYDKSKHCMKTGRRGVIMAMAVNKCLESVLKEELVVQRLKDTIEQSHRLSGCNKEDILKIVCDNQNFKDYEAINEIMIKCVAFAMDTKDLKYFAGCMSCFVLLVKRFRLLKETIINLLLQIKEMLEIQAIPVYSEDPEELKSSQDEDLQKLMWYGVITALSKIHILGRDVIKAITPGILSNEFLSQDEKVMFCVDILIHNYLNPFHKIKHEEKFEEWTLFESTLEESDYLLSKFSGNWVERKSLIKGLYLIRIVIKNLEDGKLQYFCECVCQYLSKTKYFSYQLLKNLLFKYLCNREKRLIRDEAIKLISTKKERHIDFVLKILKLTSDLDYSKFTNSEAMALTEITSKTLKECLTIVLDKQFVNRDTKIIKIVTILSNCYHIKLTEEDIEQISGLIIDNIKLEKLEKISALDIALRINNIEAIRLQIQLFDFIQEYLSPQELHKSDQTPYELWVGLCITFLKQIDSVYSNLCLGLFSQHEANISIRNLYLLKMDLNKLKPVIAKPLGYFIALVEILICSIRLLLGRKDFDCAIKVVKSKNIPGKSRILQILQSGFTTDNCLSTEGLKEIISKTYCLIMQ
ncbi:unnamed protein product [Moneuplotes crassus]|uniref:Uncharacterized protein n=1 Tax=Euplotes crassus TaxID=5936 RepID=A0AAD2DCP7_EUPCR|nr:unnamed protein product [Moneuplotes crassus]